MLRSLLVTGASGYLGRRVATEALAAGWSVTGTYHTAPAPLDDVSWHPLEIRDRAAVRTLLQELRPDAVIHAATGAMDDWAANADGAANVAVAATRTGARLVHLSSDAVFAGTAARYDETAPPDPVYRYGAAKAAAETAVRAIAPRAAIVRTSLILGDGDSKHERFVHDLHAGRVTGVLYADQYRNPVHVDDLAAAVLELAAADYHGVLNVAGTDELNRHELALLIARRDNLDPARLPAGRFADLGRPGPIDNRLCLDRARAVLTTRLRGAHEFLAPLPVPSGA